MKGLNGGILVLGSLPPGVQNEYELLSKIFLKSKRNFRRYLNSGLRSRSL